MTIFWNSTIASLGLIPGEYTYTLPNDTVTVIVLGTVPEPASWAMMIVGLGFVGGAMRRRNQSTRTTVAYV